MADPARGRVSARISVRLTPRASRDVIEGYQPGAGARGDVLIVRVTAPPTDGRANDALERLLAAALNLSSSSVRVVGGLSTRSKVVEIDGLSAAEARSLLEAAARRH